jgi:hypothetical protein
MDYNMHDTSMNTPRDTLDTDRDIGHQTRQTETMEMKQWAADHKVNKLIPSELVPLLAKDGAKQMEIVMRNMSLGRGDKQGAGG